MSSQKRRQVAVWHTFVRRPAATPPNCGKALKLLVPPCGGDARRRFDVSIVVPAKWLSHFVEGFAFKEPQGNLVKLTYTFHCTSQGHGKNPRDEPRKRRNGQSATKYFLKLSFQDNILKLNLQVQFQKYAAQRLNEGGAVRRVSAQP